MAKLHIFIDGSWLIKVCNPNGVLAQRMDNPDQFKLDFMKLKTTIFEHVRSKHTDCTEIGDCYFVTSIFDLPSDFSTWTGKIVSGNPITRDQIGKTTWNVNMRQDYAKRALAAGYESNGIITVPFKPWMIPKLGSGRFQEKQVDTTVVALFVKYAITKSNDFFAVLAGDSDILPAINIAYPEFTDKLCLVTTHPDQLDAAHRQTSFSFLQHTYTVPPIFLHNHVEKITEGTHVYVCSHCNKVFIRTTPVSQYNQPYCSRCQSMRT